MSLELDRMKDIEMVMAEGLADLRDIADGKVDRARKLLDMLQQSWSAGYDYGFDEGRKRV